MCKSTQIRSWTTRTFLTMLIGCEALFTRIWIAFNFIALDFYVWIQTQLRQAGKRYAVIMSLIERPRQCVVIICDDKKQSTWQANQTLQRMTLLLLRNKKNVHNFPPVEDLQSFIIIRTRPRRILRSKYFSPSQPSESASLQMFSRFFLEWLSVFQLV